MSSKRQELLERLREIEAERPPDDCKLKEFLQYLGRRSEVEVELRKFDMHPLDSHPEVPIVEA